MSWSTAWSSRWLVGSSRRRQDGRVVITVARASRVRCPPDRVPIRRSASSPPSPSRSADSAARRSASQAPCATARSRAAAYAVWPTSSTRSAESRSTSATIRRRGARALARTSPTVASSRNGGSWPSMTRSSGTSTVPVTTARGGRVPARARSRVDLPEPFSPTRPVRRPGETVRSRSCSTCRVPNQTSRPVTWTEGRWSAVDAGMREPFDERGRTRRAVPRARVGQPRIHMMRAV